MKRLLPLAALLLLAACAESPTDEKLEDAVRAKFHDHPALLADHLRIRSENGVVYLTGLVSTYREFVDAEQVARTAPGVTKVVNLTTVDDARF